MDKKRHRVRIFRTDYYDKLDQKELMIEIKKIFEKCELDDEIFSDTKKILNFLIQAKLMMRLERFHDVTDPKKYKWPKKVEIGEVQKIDNEVNFLAFTITKKKSRIWPTLMLLLVLIICLFPLWPLSIRLVVFYLSLYFLMFTLVFSIIRFIIFYVFRLFGYEFWILPEIFENDSFRPYYTFKKLEDGKLWIALRIVLMIGTVAYLIFLYQTP